MTTCIRQPGCLHTCYHENLRAFFLTSLEAFAICELGMAQRERIQGGIGKQLEGIRRRIVDHFRPEDLQVATIDAFAKQALEHATDYLSIPTTDFLGITPDIDVYAIPLMHAFQFELPRQESKPHRILYRESLMREYIPQEQEKLWHQMDSAIGRERRGQGSLRDARKAFIALALDSFLTAKAREMLLRARIEDLNPNAEVHIMYDSPFNDQRLTEEVIEENPRIRPWRPDQSVRRR